MKHLTVGVVATSRKENEHRLAIHPAHLDRIDPGLRGQIFLEHGYGDRFGYPDEVLAPLVAGHRTREELFAECDVLLLAKPLAEDLEQMRPGTIVWGWPHCVQDARMTQLAVDRDLTLIAWEAMNHWTKSGAFSVHVFHKNNELAGYCSVMHALQLRGVSGDYGRRMRAAVISFGATARGAVRALSALGISDVTVLTQRSVSAVASPFASVRMQHFQRDPGLPGHTLALKAPEPGPLAEMLANYDVVVNCMFQDTSFADPMFTVGDDLHYYGVDHSPSFLWDSATWENSEALLEYLPAVLGGPEAWDASETIRRAIEIRGGRVQNPRILSFQGRADAYPYAVN